MRYFAYGANMHPRQMAKGSPAARVLGPGLVEGFRLTFSVYSDRWKGGAANIMPDEGGRVWGVVWDVPEEDVAKLDTFVGHPTFYRHDDVAVRIADSLETCRTYRIAHQHGYVKPDPGYVQLLRSAIREQGLPVEALDLLERAAALPYPRIDT